MGLRYLSLLPDPLDLVNLLGLLTHLDLEGLGDLLARWDLLGLLLLVRRQPLTDPMDLPDQ